MNFKDYKQDIEKLNKLIKQLKLKEEEKKEWFNVVEEIEDKFKKYENYIALNFEVYEKEKEILLNHFIEKDNEVNEVYLELNGYKETIFYKSFAIARKMYRKLFKRNKNEVGK